MGTAANVLRPQVVRVVVGPLREGAGGAPRDVFGGGAVGRSGGRVRERGRLALVAGVVGEAEQEVGVGGRESALATVVFARLLGRDHLEAYVAPGGGRDRVHLLAAAEEFGSAQV